MDWYFDIVFYLNLTEKEVFVKDIVDVCSEQERLRCRYIDVIEDEEGNRKRLTWRDVALRVYRKDDENAIWAITRLHKSALESINLWGADKKQFDRFIDTYQITCKMA